MDDWLSPLTFLLIVSAIVILNHIWNKGIDLPFEVRSVNPSFVNEQSKYLMHALVPRILILFIFLPYFYKRKSFLPLDIILLTIVLAYSVILPKWRAKS